jgi:uncharacterized protein (DUF2252 family)
VAFFRGTPQLYARDFAQSDIFTYFGTQETRTWITGDQHGANFGTLSDAKQECIYEVTDFDESLVEDFQYDLLRLSTYIVLIGITPDCGLVVVC